MIAEKQNGEQHSETLSVYPSSAVQCSQMFNFDSILIILNVWIQSVLTVRVDLVTSMSSSAYSSTECCGAVGRAATKAG